MEEVVVEEAEEETKKVAVNEGRKMEVMEEAVEVKDENDEERKEEVVEETVEEGDDLTKKVAVKEEVLPENHEFYG